MNFKEWFFKMTENVLVHIDGPSGSGKTTIKEELEGVYSKIKFKDLDEFDDEAVADLGYSKVLKNDYSDEMIYKLYLKRQHILNDFILHTDKKIVLVGMITEGPYILNFYAKERFLLNISPKMSAERAYMRSQKEKPEHRRKKSELSQDIKEAEKYRSFLLYYGYKLKSHDQIINWFKDNIDENVK